ncbi:Arylsulfatase B [Hondaea fermentalgiana]|uniref:Arylsulfatase B n=1 Tax=Hondaea fermentalgiana TaxID=2315210 RepID=A0A2R5FZJ9_9STRA|nr:Arylsulfatase B [Hondaea fermentalgiana]|eukprot:GBG24187.1 Arylsulfatase B [Hondaea fermentalgiana]
MAPWRNLATAVAVATMVQSTMGISSRSQDMIDDVLFKQAVLAGDIDVARSSETYEWRRSHENVTPPDTLDGEEVSVSDEEAQAAVGTKPNILVFLWDDLGLADAGFAPQAREETQESMPFLTQLAEEEGVILTRHYASWHCSPSRRSFLTGREPTHVGGDELTDFEDDDMDMRMTWISEKLTDAGYYSLFYGKGHIGARSIRMLPRHRGFHEHMGFLGGSQTYYGSGGRWKNLEMDTDSTYSALYWGNSMVSNIKDELAESSPRPIFLFYALQAPHTPLKSIPSNSRYSNSYGSTKYYNEYQDANVENFDLLQWNVYAADVEIERVVSLFQDDEAVWNNTLVVFISDNGGTSNKAPGNNYPLRGEKGTAFEGGFRTASFVSGGIIPASQRGSFNNKIYHISDWYRTFCNLAGVSGDDDPPMGPAFPNLTLDDVPDAQYPNVTDPTNSSRQVDAYGMLSYPPVDSKDMWPSLMQPTEYARDAVHPVLVLSREAVLMGDMKLILAQPCSMGITSDIECKDDVHFGWVDRDNIFSDDDGLDCLQFFDNRDVEAFMDGSFRFRPCLFNVTADYREKSPIDDVETQTKLWAALNETLLYQYTIRLPIKGKFGMTPFYCSGPCFEYDYALTYYGLNPSNSKQSSYMVPQCGVYQTDAVGHDFCPTGGPGNLPLADGSRL